MLFNVIHGVSWDAPTVVESLVKSACSFGQIPQLKPSAWKAEFSSREIDTIQCVGWLDSYKSIVRNAARGILPERSDIRGNVGSFAIPHDILKSKQWFLSLGSHQIGPQVAGVE